MRPQLLATLLLSGVLLVSPGLDGPAAAQLTAPELSAARRNLTRYDLGGGTADVLRRLTAFLEHAREADSREARYLRAVAATDLLLMARSRDEARVRAEVSSALGVPPGDLVSWLDRELRAVDVGAYSAQVDECRWALRVMSADPADPDALRMGEGLRRDVLYVHRMVDAFGDEDTVARLQPYGRDPCAGGQTCILDAFAEEGRRAVDALLEAEAALTRLEHIEAAGEPLTASLAGIVAADAVVLRTYSIQPPLRIPDAIFGVGTRGSAADLDMLFVIEPDGVRYGFAPSVRVSGGAVQFGALGEPTLPQTARIPLAEDHRTVVVPYSGLVDQLRALLSVHTVGHVGVAAAPDVYAFTASRVLASLHAAGITHPDLIGRGLEGEARRVSVEIVDAPEFERTPLHLFVRMGGYTLWAGRRGESIPRIRDPQGRLRFDLATLEERADGAPRTRGQLRYMTSVDWQTVLEAAFHLPERAWPLTVLLH